MLQVQDWALVWSETISPLVLTLCVGNIVSSDFFDSIRVSSWCTIIVVEMVSVCRSRAILIESHALRWNVSWLSQSSSPDSSWVTVAVIWLLLFCSSFWWIHAAVIIPINWLLTQSSSSPSSITICNWRLNLLFSLTSSYWQRENLLKVPWMERIVGMLRCWINSWFIFNFVFSRSWLSQSTSPSSSRITVNWLLEVRSILCSPNFVGPWEDFLWIRSIRKSAPLWWRWTIRYQPWSSSNISLIIAIRLDDCPTEVFWVLRVKISYLLSHRSESMLVSVSMGLCGTKQS